ncbi:hypothetical protein JNJ66_07175 [Candidatus Saccharibacteria bacterium]|nr:hypothetical protein [Candidatus Saccharibacteria bacterium]
MTKKQSQESNQQRSKTEQPKTKIQKVEQLYGKGKSTASLEDASKYFKSIGYESLANLLTPAK